MESGEDGDGRDGRDGLAPSAGLRNRLAHEYNKMDHGLVYDALGTALATVPRYLEAVEAALG